MSDQAERTRPLDMSSKAAEITDPLVLLERIIYRNDRMVERMHLHTLRRGFVRMMASRTRSDLRRLRELLCEEDDGERA